MSMLVVADNLALDFYHLDYLTQSSSRASPQERPAPSRVSRASPPKKFNFALVEDPLLASISGQDSNMPLTPPADVPTFQSMEVKLPQVM